MTRRPHAIRPYAIRPYAIRAGKRSERGAEQ
jgi:hypothetical protein